MKKKILSVVLALTLLLSALPLQAMAVPTQGTQKSSSVLNPGWVGNENVLADGTIQEGGVKIEKSAAPTSVPNEFEITLKVEGKDIVVSNAADVVLVIDRSGSMKGSKMTDTKNAAKKFVDQLLTKENSVRIGVVSFAQSATNNSLSLDETTNGLVGYSQAEALKNVIQNNISANGGTNIQAGIKMARDILAKSPAKQKYIVLLGDGQPTYSYKVTSVSGTLPESPGAAGDYQITGINYNSRVGDGSDYTFDYNDSEDSAKRYSDVVNYYETGWMFKEKHYFPVPDNNGEATVYEAGLAKAADIGIYSVALQAGTTGEKVLKDCQNKGYYSANPEDLDKIFAAFADSIQETLKDSAITDPMSDSVMLLDNTYGDGVAWVASHGTVSEKDGVISWNPGTLKTGVVATLKYKVRLDVEAPGFEEGKYVETNKATTLEYAGSDGTKKTLNFKVPQVCGEFSKFYTRGYLVNEAGKFIGADGTVVSSKEEAAILYTDEEINSRNGANQWSFQTKVLTAKTLEGYTLVGNSTQSVTTTVTDKNGIAWFPYQVKTQDFTVEYYLQNVNGQGYTQDETLTENGKIAYGTSKYAANYIKSITGFTYDANNANAISTITFHADSTTGYTLKLYYNRSHNYKVTTNWVEVDANGQVVKQLQAPDVQEGLYYEAPYTAKEHGEFTGFTYKDTEGAVSGTISGDVVVTHRFTRNSNYTVTTRWIEVDENNRELKTLRSDYVNPAKFAYEAPYRAETADTFEGFTYQDTLGKIEGVVTGNMVITHRYVRNSNYSVITQWIEVDADGNKIQDLKDADTQTGLLYEASYEAKAAGSFEGFTFKTTVGDEKGTITDDVVVVHQFIRNSYKVTTNWIEVDKDGNPVENASPVKPSVTSEPIPYLNNYAAEASGSTPHGFTFVKTEGTVSGQITGDVVVNHLYTRNSYTVTTNWIELGDDGNPVQGASPVKPTVISSPIPYQSPFAAAEKGDTPYGFEFVRTEGTVSGDSITENVVVNHYYVREKFMVTTSFVEVDQNGEVVVGAAPVKPQDVQTGIAYQSSYTAASSEPVPDGFVYVRTNGTESGNIESDVYVTHYYKRALYKVTTQWVEVDDGNNVLKTLKDEDVQSNIPYQSDYSAKDAGSFDGFTLKETVGVESGKITGDVVVIHRFTRNSNYTVTTRWIEVDGNNEEVKTLKKDYVQGNYKYEAPYAAEQAETFGGFTYQDTVGDMTGEVRGNVVVTHRYTRNNDYTVTTRWVEVDKDGKEVKSLKTDDIQTGLIYEADYLAKEAGNINGFTFQGTEGIMSGKITDHVVVTHKYVRNNNYSVTTRWVEVDQNGKVLKSLKTDDIQTGFIFEAEYAAKEAGTINGFTFKQTVGDVTGIILGNVVVEHQFTRNSDYTVITNWIEVDADGNKVKDLKAADTQTGFSYEASYEAKAAGSFEGFTYQDTDGDIKGKIKDNVVVTHRFVRNSDYTVITQWIEVDANGDKVKDLKDADTQTGLAYEASYKAKDAGEFDGFTFKRTVGETSGTITGNVVVVHEFTRNSDYTVTTQWIEVDADGNKVKDLQSEDIQTGFAYEASYEAKAAGNFDGFTFKRTVGEASGEITGNVVVVHEFTRRNDYMVTTQWVEVDAQGNVISTLQPQNVQEGLAYEASYTAKAAGTIDGFTFKQTVGVMQGVIKENVLVVHQFTRNSYTVTTNWIEVDAEGNPVDGAAPVKPSVTSNPIPYQSAFAAQPAGTTPHGFTFVETQGTMSGDAITNNMVVNHLYTRNNYTVTTKWLEVDADGNVIADAAPVKKAVVSDPIPYQSAFAAVEAGDTPYGFEFVETVGTMSGDSINGDVVVEHHYVRAKYTVTTSFVEVDQNGEVVVGAAPVKPQDVQTGIAYQSSYKAASHSPVPDGFVYVRTNGNESGNIESDVCVTHYYKRALYTVTTQWVEVDGSNNVLKTLKNDDVQRDIPYQSDYSAKDAGSFDGFTFKDTAGVESGKITGNVVVTHRFTRNSDYTVTTRWVEVDENNNELSVLQPDDVQTGLSYEQAYNAKLHGSFEGFTYQDTVGEMTGYLTSNVTVTHRFTRNSDYTVTTQWVEVDQNGNVLNTLKAQDVQTGLAYEDPYQAKEAGTINGFTFKATVGQLEGVVKGNVTVVHQFIRNSDYTVITQWIEVDANGDKVKDLKAADTQTGLSYEASYEAKAAGSFDGFTYQDTDGDIKGKIKDNVVVTHRFVRNSDYTVITQWIEVDANGDKVKDLKDADTQTGLSYEASYEAKAAGSFDGFTFKQTVGNMSGTITGNVVVVHEFTRNSNYTVTTQWIEVDAEGNEIATLQPQDVQDGLAYEAPYTAKEAGAIDGFTFKATVGEVNGTILDNVLVVHQFTRNSYIVTTNWIEVDADGNVVADAVPVKASVTSDPILYQSAFAAEEAGETPYGFTFVKTEGIQSGDSITEDMIVNHLYTRNSYTVTTNWVEVDADGNVIEGADAVKPSVTSDPIAYQSPYAAEEAGETPYGFVFVKTEGDLTGASLNDDMVVNHYYVRADYTLTVNFVEVDADGNVIAGADPVKPTVITENLPYMSVYDAAAGETPEGFLFVRTEGETEGVMEADTVVTHYYTREDFELTIVYVYEDGSEAAVTHQQTLAYGSEYAVTSPMIEGFTADILEVTGTMPAEDVAYRVVYVEDEEFPDEEPPLVPPDEEEPPVDDFPDDEVPRTGSDGTLGNSIAIAVLALGGVILLAKKRKGEDEQEEK